MHLIALPIKGAYLIEPEPKRDGRGYFMRVWCNRVFREYGLMADCVQANISVTEQRGTIRGLHYQRPPSQEAKLVRCARGAIFDVMVDARKESRGFGAWHGQILDAERLGMLYVPPGVAHGFQTLADDTEIHYWMSDYYDPDSECGIRFNDPVVGVEWPLDPTQISARDRRLPRLEQAARGRFT